MTLKVHNTHASQNKAELPMDMELRVLITSDLNAITEVHIAAFPDSALTKLGNEAVRRYYEWQIIGPHDAIRIGAFNNDNLIGFCFGGVFRGALGGFLEKNRGFLIRQVITHPWLLLNPLFRERAQFALQRLYRKFVPQRKPALDSFPSSQTPSIPSFGILSIAVIPEARGQGAADSMMQHAETVAVSRGFRQMNLTVHPSNDRAIRFYEKMGWARNSNEGEWTGHMSKRIIITSRSDEPKENSL